MGLLLAMIAACIGTGKDIISKKVSVSVNGNISAFASFAFAVPFYLVLLLGGLYLGVESLTITLPFLGFVLARSISDTFAETTKMHALQEGEFSTIISLISLHPVISLLTSPLITGDPITVPITLGVIAAVLGNLIIMTAGAALPTRRAVTLGLLNAFFFSVNTCFDRLSVGAGTPIMSGLTMNILAGIFLLPTLPQKLTGQLTVNARPFLMRGFLEAAFMSVKLNALRFLTGPELSAIMRINLIFSVISGKKVFAEVGFARKLFGAILTTGGIAIMLLG